MCPGTAQGYGYLGPDEVPIFTLPGAPESAFVAFELFVRPMIRSMLGLPRLERAQIQARLSGCPSPGARGPQIPAGAPARTAVDAAAGHRVSSSRASRACAWPTA